MKHTIEISTTEALLLLHVLDEMQVQRTLTNETDKQMAKRLLKRILEKVVTEL